ncbi:MAG: hypothetical protein JO081_13480 [Alphaproteobacteria bacterium]|nr:hypothetical protein [Alphaproteobacteria bacterium]
MSDEAVTLELLGARLLGLTADVRDLQQRFAGMEARLATLETRFSALEARFTGMEARMAVLEERMSRMLSLIVRIAKQQGVRE